MCPFPPQQRRAAAANPQIPPRATPSATHILTVTALRYRDALGERSEDYLAHAVGEVAVASKKTEHHSPDTFAGRTKVAWQLSESTAVLNPTSATRRSENRC